jgi:hypothetical protein
LTQEAKGKIEEGRQLLRERKFPAEIIESIKEKRLRKYVRSEIFKYDVHYSQINKAEKKKRSDLLKVQLKHTDFLSAMDKYIPAAIILMLIGFITILTSLAGMNEPAIWYFIHSSWNRTLLHSICG